MTIDRRLLNWGLFFILLGAVPLALQQGWLGQEVARDLWRLWPLIIVGLGVGILLRRTSAAPLGGLIVAGTFGLLFGGLLATGISFGVTCSGPGSRPGTAFDEQGAFNGGRAQVRLELDCGKLSVASAPGSVWALAATDDPARLPQVDKASDSLTIRSPRESAIFPFGSGIERDWQVTLPTDQELSLDVRANAASGRLDLAGLSLQSLVGNFNAWDGRVDLGGASINGLTLTYNAGAGSLVLPAESTFSGSVEMNAASLDICAPDGVGLRISVRGNVTNTNFAGSGLLGGLHEYRNAEYATASHRIDLDIHANAGNITLNPGGGCR